MFFQEATPDTSGYMIAGYAITFLVMALYVASMYLRNRNLTQDMTTLQELEKPVPPARLENASPSRKTRAMSDNKTTRSVTKKTRKK